ncbi:hypothetical protein QFZ77_000568 [Paenibacillus sp. V4I3]|uniref:hypothetical protein n=1 Tax=Paenibacillus sp. V4I3 TaxID=3042305 RepID=UPI00277D2C28|nr:hypothetical protein [Paenibacillus sp. V4I3]
MQIQLFISRKKAANNPINGKKAQSLITKVMLVASASVPSTADPIPLKPKANPKNNPDTVPTLPGSSGIFILFFTM